MNTLPYTTSPPWRIQFGFKQTFTLPAPTMRIDPLLTRPKFQVDAITTKFASPKQPPTDV